MIIDNLTLIIPAYNESQAITDVLKNLRDRLPSAELIVVDDGSTDDTAALARQAGAAVISHDFNCGYGASLRTGILASTKEYVLFCDADGQHSIEDVEKVIAAADGCDMVVGARDKNSHKPVMRRPGKLVLCGFANHLAGMKIPDLNSGLRLFNKKVLLKYLHLMPRGFSFSTTSTFAFLKGNHRIKWVPITVRKRKGKSSVRQWRHGMQTIMLMLRLTVLFEPLKVFLEVAGIMFFLTAVNTALDITSSLPNINISDSTVTCAVTTVLVFLFGLLCDQVSAIRRELHDKRA